MIIINRSRYLDTSTYHYSMCRSISISRLRLFVIDWNVFSMIRWRSSIWIITCAISTKYITAESIKSKINISLIHFNNSFRLWIFRRFLFLRQQDEQDEKKKATLSSSQKRMIVLLDYCPLNKGGLIDEQLPFK